MNAERWQRIKELFEHALALPPAAREGFLLEECADDAGVLEEVRAMLARTADSRFLEPPAAISGDVGEPHLGRVLGDFELLQPIGQGGMGLVFLALQQSLQRTVALKVLPAFRAFAAEDRARFAREARNMATLSHPGIVPVYSVGEWQGTHYFAMEFVPGHDLARELAHVREHSKDLLVLPEFEARDYITAVATLVEQVARALQHAHEKGVVHRDVKPENLLLSADGRVLLADFGLARGSHLGSVSRTDSVAGTPYYMSPEQAQLSRAEPVDHRTDVYSLGVVLYEMLTLERPFKGRTSLEVLARITGQDPVDIRRLNKRVAPDLRTICGKAMEKNARQRYASAGALAEDLRRFLNHETILATPPSVARIASLWVRRHKVGLGAAAILVAGTTSGVWWNARHARAGSLSTLGREVDRFLGDASTGVSGQARALVDEIDRLSQPSDDVPADLAARFRLVRSRFEARSTELTRIARERVASFTPPERRTLETPVGGATSRGDVLLGLSDLLTYTGNLPDDLAATLRRLQTARLEVRVHSDDATRAVELILEPLDEITSVGGAARRAELVQRGPDTLVAEVATGYWRVWVVQEGFGFAELQRVLPVTDRTYVLDAWIRRTEDVTSSMTRFAGGPATAWVDRYGDASDAGPEAIAETLDDYYLGPDVVTIEEFQAFVTAGLGTGSPLWPAELSATERRMPATNVGHETLQRYLEWRCRRLPMLVEWQFALGARQDAVFGGRDSASIDWQALLLGRADPDLYPAEGPERLRARWQWFLATLRPVGTSPLVVNGLRNVLDGGAQWTDTLGLSFSKGTYQASFGSRYRVSADPTLSVADARTRGFLFATLAGTIDTSATATFRGAKSARPPRLP